MNKLMNLESKYARGGRVSTPHALMAVRRAIGHLQKGNHAAAKAALESSPDAMNHPMVQQALPMLAPPNRMAEGGQVEQRPYGSSSPGSPGVLGAIHDAVNALKDYVIDRPRRELADQRNQMEQSYLAHGEPGYAEGGKVSAATNMAKFLEEKMGLSTDHAKRLANQYHSATLPTSPVAQQMANDLATRQPVASTMKKSPAQLAQELRAGHVDPKDMQHLMYTDPTLTPLINRYQSGTDNQNLTPAQKEALIRKLQTLGPPQPQMPQRGAPPAMQPQPGQQMPMPGPQPPAGGQPPPGMPSPFGGPPPGTGSGMLPGGPPSGGPPQQ